MNTGPLRTYAPEARKSFITAVSAQAARLGITALGIAEAHVQGDVLLVGGQAYPSSISRARQALVARVALGRGPSRARGAGAQRWK